MFLWGNVYPKAPFAAHIEADVYPNQRFAAHIPFQFSRGNQTPAGASSAGRACERARRATLRAALAAFSRSRRAAVSS